MEKKYQSGISYLEAITVVAIILILSAIATPVIASFLPHYRLKGGGQELIAALRDAQNLATTTQNFHLIRLNANDNSYSLIRKIDGSETTIKTTTLPTNVYFSQINLTNNQVGFSSSGSPEMPGTIIIRNTKNETITIEITTSGQIKSY